MIRVRRTPGSYCLAPSRTTGSRLVLPEDATLRPDDTDTFSVVADVYGLPTIMSSRQLGDPFAAGFTVRAGIAFIGDEGASGRIQVSVNDPGPLQRWRQLAWTYDGSGVAAGFAHYIDATQAALTTVFDEGPDPQPGAGSEYIGAQTTNGSTFSSFSGGLISRLMYFNYELTDADVRELLANADPADATLSGAAPYGYWPLNRSGVDEGTGANHVSSDADFVGEPYRRRNTSRRSRLAPDPLRSIFGANLLAFYDATNDRFLYDRSGNGHHLSVESGTPTYTTLGDRRAITVAGGLLLRSTTLGAALAGSQVPFSVVLWCGNVSSLPILWQVHDADGPAYQDLTLVSGMTGTEASFARNDDSANLVSFAGVAASGGQFFAASYEDGNADIYVDGNTAGGTLDVNPCSFDAFDIGDSAMTPAGTFDLAQFAVIDRAITAAEAALVRSLYV